MGNIEGVEFHRYDNFRLGEVIPEAFGNGGAIEARYESFNTYAIELGEFELFISKYRRKGFFVRGPRIWWLLTIMAVTENPREIGAVLGSDIKKILATARAVIEGAEQPHFTSLADGLNALKEGRAF